MNEIDPFCAKPYQPTRAEAGKTHQAQGETA
jgi:hypothetical protein